MLYELSILFFCFFNHYDSAERALFGTDPAPFTVVEADLKVAARIEYGLGRAVYPAGTTTFTFLTIQDWTKRTPVPRIHYIEFLSRRSDMPFFKFHTGFYI
jgi:hypothetical protein